jgi:hypothetical protein
MAANDGDVTGYGPNHGYAWGWFPEPLIVTFPESITINKVEVLLLDVDGRAYDLRLEVRAGGEWRPVEERTRASGWLTFVLGPTECSAIRLVFTGGTLPVRSYHIVEVAAYSDPRPEADSPLKKAWLKARKDRERGELGLLGVDEALEAVFLNEAAFKRAKALKEGERRWIDLDRDGDPDLIILKDQGAVVVVIDDDDDAGANGILPPAPLPSEGGEGNGRTADGVGAEAPPTTAGDRDSDCWVVDLDLDGRPDRVLDYIDDDGDGDADLGLRRR